MKSRILMIALPLFVLSVFPVSTRAQSASASQSVDSDRGPIPEPHSTDFWDGDEPNVANLILHPFASKKYVNRHTQPIRDRLSELEELTSSNTKAIHDVDARAQQGIQMASAKANDADQHATDATNKAQAAQLAATQATTRVSAAEQRIGSIDQYKASTQTEIIFRAGQTALSKNAKDALDEMAAPLKTDNHYVIEVRGYAAGRGQAAIASSKKMADSVLRYLVLNHEIPSYRIFVMGVGNTADGGGAAVKHGGRVEVSVMRNDLQASAKQ